MEVGGVLVSLLLAAFSLPCLLLLLVLAEAGVRLASLALQGGRYSWPTRSDFLGYRIARGGRHSSAAAAAIGGRFSYPISGGGGGGGGLGMEEETLPAACCDRLAVAVYRRGRDAPPVDCVFCLSRVDDGEEVRQLRCRHVFHRACLDAWLVRPRATCPLCRDCLLPSEPPRSFPLDYYDDDDDVHFGFNDFSITSSTTTSPAAAAAAYPHGVALWPM
ncbi:E3 ubiquitin-protein ligase EL5-like [Oryza brachyantha]|uniref:E3 ubiquitin-protein ligase EL5-like n=1 Tax=Oryza brachyantha TaxID=4533 RepID=UPI001ADAA186|nr:E3 ubiquitin-protein ligase EL5-like [Oryza brachyantha]